jgi:hypothetical protein
MEFRARVDRPAPFRDRETQGEPAGPSDPRATYPTMLRIDVRGAREGEICNLQLQLGSEDQKDWVVIEDTEIHSGVSWVRWPVPPVPARRLRLQLEPHGDTEVRPWRNS